MELYQIKERKEDKMHNNLEKAYTNVSTWKLFKLK